MGRATLISTRWWTWQCRWQAKPSPCWGRWGSCSGNCVAHQRSRPFVFVCRDCLSQPAFRNCCRLRNLVGIGKVKAVSIDGLRKSWYAITDTRRAYWQIQEFVVRFVKAVLDETRRAAARRPSLSCAMRACVRACDSAVHAWFPRTALDRRPALILPPKRARSASLRSRP